MSIEGLPSFALDAGRPLGRRFAALGLDGYREPGEDPNRHDPAS